MGWWLPAAVLLVACEGGGELVVQVRTDLAAGREIDEVRAEVLAGTEVVLSQRIDAPESTGLVRVLEGAVAPGEYLVFAEARLAGEVVVSRPARVLVDGTTVSTILLTRDCLGVICPDSGGGDERACVGGRCALETCTEETPDACPTPECAGPIDCVSVVGCGAAECTSSGSCLQPPEGTCGMGRLCHPLWGCADPDGPCTGGELTISDGSCACGNTASAMGIEVCAGERRICAGETCACEPGWGDCDGMPANGCEVNTDEGSLGPMEILHCGECFATCRLDQACVDGGCL